MSRDLRSNLRENSRQIVIAPNRRWFHFDWQGLLQYRDLLYFLVRRDFVSKYKQTILGPLWFIIQPILTTVFFTIIFGKMVRISTDSLPPVLFYLCGLLAWNYFSQCLNSTSVTLSANVHIFGKVFFPRLIVPVSVVMSNLFAFLLQFFTFLAFYIFYKFFTPAGALIRPTIFLWMLPFLVLQTAMLSLGVGLLISALTVRYRDFHHLMGFLSQLWMYATPIVYPMSSIPEKKRIILELNPMTSIVECFRFAFFGKGLIEPVFIVISMLVTILLFLVGLFAFNKVERTFVDLI